MMFFDIFLLALVFATLSQNRVKNLGLNRFSSLSGSAVSSSSLLIDTVDSYLSREVNFLSHAKSVSVWHEKIVERRTFGLVIYMRKYTKRH